jgi:hypothetical protein
MSYQPTNHSTNVATVTNSSHQSFDGITTVPNKVCEQSVETNTGTLGWKVQGFLTLQLMVHIITTGLSLPSAHKIIYPFSPVRRILFSRKERKQVNSQKWSNKNNPTNKTRMHIRESHACSFIPQIHIKMSSADSVPRKDSGLHHSKTSNLKGVRSTGCAPKCQEQEMLPFYE